MAELTAVVREQRAKLAARARAAAESERELRTALEDAVKEIQRLQARDTQATEAARKIDADAQERARAQAAAEEALAGERAARERLEARLLGLEEQMAADADAAEHAGAGGEASASFAGGGAATRRRGQTSGRHSSAS